MEINSFLKRILDISISLTGEKNHLELLDKILNESMSISSADAGTLYIYKNNLLYFKLMKNISMGTNEGLNSEINLPPVALDDTTVSGYAGRHKKIVNIADVYNDSSFNWDGPKRYDKMTGYHTKSQLVIPLIDKEGRLIGVIQLINRIVNGEITSFSKDIEYVVASLGSLSAILLSNKMLLDNIQNVLDSFVRAMTTAIDSRTPYNANHTKNVARLCSEFVDFLNEHKYYSISKNDKDQLVMAAMLHDIGKMIVPLAILNKTNRLEDRINLIAERYKIIKLDLENKYLKGIISKKELLIYNNELDNDLSFIKELNDIPFLSEDNKKRVNEIKNRYFNTSFGSLSLLMGDEVDMMLIPKGTLTASERAEVEKHVVYTKKILDEIDFGEKYKDVGFIASNHHELLDGSGYPNGLKGESLPLLVRIITIMDIFESLTSKDRPYKKPLPIPVAYKILKEMVMEGKLDSTLVGYMCEYLGL